MDLRHKINRKIEKKTDSRPAASCERVYLKNKPDRFSYYSNMNKFRKFSKLPSRQPTPIKDLKIQEKPVFLDQLLPLSALQKATQLIRRKGLEFECRSYKNYLKTFCLVLSKHKF